MPNFKTHSIHGELILPEIEKEIDISNEDIKSFCIGPDTLFLTDYKTFDYQHANKTKEYFTSMLKLIKDNKLYDNKEVIAFLYGQIDHFILDVIIHPLIYYMTENIESEHKIDPHSLIEMWTDEYVIKKYNKNNALYYHKLLINDVELLKMIDELYKKVYGVNYEGIKYSLGLLSVTMFDSLARRNLIGIVPPIIKMVNIGDFTYKNNDERVIPYLNSNKEIWYNPETGEEYKYSFDDLWKKSIEIALDTIDDVNKFIYKDKKLTTPFILENISYNTGLPCEKGQCLKYVKRYK